MKEIKERWRAYPDLTILCTYYSKRCNFVLDEKKFQGIIYMKPLRATNYSYNFCCSLPSQRKKKRFYYQQINVPRFFFSINVKTSTLI